MQVHVRPVQADHASRKASSRLGKRRTLLGPNKFLSSNVSWSHKSKLGKSKTNITFTLKNKSRPVVSHRNYKVLKTKEDIREIIERIRGKKEQRKGEVLELDSSRANRVNESCVPRMNIAYIKTHKTASTTLQTVLNRFGYVNKLSFVLNKVSPKNGHFVYLPVTKHSPRLFFLPPLNVPSGNFSRYQYNMVAVHLRYNRSAMNTFMMPGTKYISIIREPSAHFESAFNHFQFADSFSFATKCRVKGHEIEEFMRKPGYYRRKLKKLPWDTARGLRWYYARNNQIFDLGLDSKYHLNETIVNRTIDILLKEIDLMLISEYFDESLVLLKQMMCWSFDDIVYISKNQRLNRVDLDDNTRRKIREWSRADTILYERFNKTLWRKIRAYGPDFERDLATFRKRKSEVFNTCVGNETVKTAGIFKHKEYIPSVNSSLFCTLVAGSKTKLFRMIWQRQGAEWTAKLTAFRNRTKTRQFQRNDKILSKDGTTHEDDTEKVRIGVSENKQVNGDEEDDESIPVRKREGKYDACIMAHEEDIDFHSSVENKLIFPEEI